MKKYLLILIICICSVQTFYSQEDDGVVSLAIPTRNSLTFNRYSINPTFSFVREQTKFISVYNKREWVDFEDAPLTYLASYSGRFGENIGAGIGLFQQNYGVLTTFGGILNFAYNAKIAHDSNLTFGLNIGAYKSGVNTGNVVTNFDDPSLQNVPENLLLTINPGINYGTQFLDFGLSVNNLALYNFESSTLIEDNPQQSIQAHIMYTGYMSSRGFFDESKFTGLLKSDFQKDETVISGVVMVTVPKGIWGQVGYNSLYGASGGVGINITKQIAIEYNYEKGFGDLNNFGSSHEITLAYRFKNDNYYDYSREDEVSSILSSGNKRRRVSKPSKSRVVSSRKATNEPKEQSETDTQANLVAAQNAKAKAEANQNKILAEQQKAQQETAAQTKLIEEQKAKELAEIQAELDKIEADKQAEARAETRERIQAEQMAKAEADAQAKLVAEQKAKAEADAQAKLIAEQKAKAEADAQAKLIAEQKAKEEVDAQAKLAAEQKAKAETDAQAKLAAEQKAKAEADALAKLVAEQKAKAEADAQAKLAAEQKAKAEADAKAKLAAEQKAKAEADAKAKLVAEQKAKEEADTQAKLLAEQKAKEEADTQVKLLAEQKAKEEADALAKLVAEQQAKEEADAQAKLVAEQKAKEEADAQAKLVAEQQAKEEADAQAKLVAEQKAKEEADVQAKLVAEQQAKAEVDAQAKADVIPNATDDLAKSMNNITKGAEESRLIQNELFRQFSDIVNIKDQDLKDLKEENDLSDQGITVQPKPFKSVTAENNALKAIKADLENVIKSRSEKIDELNQLYEERTAIGTFALDEVSLFYKKEIKRLKNEQLKAIELKIQLDKKLEAIKIATEFEKRRRIKRAAFNNEEDRYSQDRALLKSIKQTTQMSDSPLKTDDFDFGETLGNNIKILKNIDNVESGYYVIIAVHSDTDRRNKFLTNMVASGKSNIDFFHDVNTSKYYIYYDKFDYIGDANEALKAKGSKPYNGNMSIVKIEN
ncbi:PorP/SprF family type IX secretion system membrane protein [Winogradskyella bathintestinalis]|uniref:PorP/SprF family type IX secretion system membrane protein n=1 Tax=Winogradskyella bathintestinalis TaxID=3035208 RepID=A0ABT7ZXY4_9FLAO|nr:PorP/SprF family type IX secretion system membrane protein [Winogradskyella bathintestinalis]MDN3493598.1 PorP/SprF family type IX secretion system membrane protein [Winogradskyella bathintestinalis]